MADDNAWIAYGHWDQLDDCPCGCGDCASCDPECGAYGRCPEEGRQCLGEIKHDRIPGTPRAWCGYEWDIDGIVPNPERPDVTCPVCKGRKN